MNKSIAKFASRIIFTRGFSEGGIKVLMMPQLSPSMEKGKIAKWHVRPGDDLESYQLICDIDALNMITEAGGGEIGDVKPMEIEIMEDSKLCKILHNDGDVVDVHTPIAILCESPDNKDINYAINSFVPNINSQKAMWQAYKKS
jgi:pyruvate/2-oxoglutarate dehydrogenase complex dihydrolipoamide acyltransferase (E2) component